MKLFDSIFLSHLSHGCLVFVPDRHTCVPFETWLKHNVWHDSCSRADGGCSKISRHASHQRTQFSLDAFICAVCFVYIYIHRWQMQKTFPTRMPLGISLMRWPKSGGHIAQWWITSCGITRKIPTASMLLAESFSAYECVSSESHL